MFVFQSEYREDTRNKIFTGLGGNTVAAVGRRKFPFALAFTAERGDIHHLSGTIESWDLNGDGPLMLTIDGNRQVRTIGTCVTITQMSSTQSNCCRARIHCVIECSVDDLHEITACD